MKKPTDFYCSQKFWWLSVNTEKLITQSCCSASPNKIDISWIKQNPGKIFNTPTMLSERKEMLDNKPVAGCYSTCWEPESKGIVSRRMLMKSNNKTHSNINSTPEILNLIIGSHCNLTCVYCCKQYSTAWADDINTNGSYTTTNTDDRFILNDKDRILSKISQKEIELSQTKQILLEEIKLICQKSKLSKIEISGGEPFLYLYLSNLIEVLPSDVPITIVTGLGIDEKRFTKELDKIKNYQNISLIVSAENIDKNYEFVRSGNTWDRFETNLGKIQEYGIKYKFSSVLSNLTLFGLIDFIDYIGTTEAIFMPCNDPNFLSINVMDDKSKETIYNNISKLPTKVQNIIKDSIDKLPTIEQHTNLKNYLNEFSKRRNYSVDIFPKTFINWINHVV